MVRGKLSRRGFLRLSSVAAAGAVISACAPATPQIVEIEKQVPVEKQVVKEVPVERVVEKVVKETVVVEKAAAPQTVTTISFITPGGLGLERSMYTNFVYRFQEENPGLKVTLSFESWGDYMTKLPTMLAGGVIPDAIHQHMSIIQDYAHRGALLDLKPWMERDGVDPEDYIPALFEVFSNRGKTYGLPKDSAAWGMYYNKAMFDEAGLDYPAPDWTMDEFHQLAVELTRDENGNRASSPSFDGDKIKQWGFAFHDPTPAGSESSRPYIMALGGDWYTEDGKQTRITEKPAIQLFEMFHQMRCVEKAIPTPADVLGQGDPFRAGLAAMAVSFHIMDFFSRQENVKFPYGVTFMPAGPGGQYTSVGCSGWAVPAGAKYQEQGWELVKFLTSEEIQRWIGEQKRWGVCRRAAVDAIIPSDPCDGFAMVHVDPFQGKVPSGQVVISQKFPPVQNRIRDIYGTEFDAIWTCGSSDVVAAATKTREQVDELLGELDW
jgi:multiple sugar transport system substrate-binding protein